MGRVLRWIGWSVGLLVVVLAIAAIVTTRSGDTSLYPPSPDAPHIEVLVVTNFHHSGIILPRAALVEAARRRSLSALTAVTTRFADHNWLEFGWGDRAFYMRDPDTGYTRTTLLALQALFRPGNPSVLLVVGIAGHPREAYPDATLVSLTLSREGFARLATMLDATFARSGPEGSIDKLGPTSYGDGLFFRAVGAFNIFRVCNHWVSDLLDAAGVPTAPVLATWPLGLLWDLTARAGAVRLPPPSAVSSGRAASF